MVPLSPQARRASSPSQMVASAHARRALSPPRMVPLSPNARRASSPPQMAPLSPNSRRASSPPQMVPLSAQARRASSPPQIAPLSATAVFQDGDAASLQQGSSGSTDRSVSGMRAICKELDAVLSESLKELAEVE